MPCTCFALRKLTRTVTRLYDMQLAAVGLKTTQYSLLRWISAESLPMAELAARTNTERTTLTRNLKPLVDAGWVELKPGADPRQKIVTITPAGRQTIAAAKDGWRKAQSQLESALGIDAVRDLHQKLDAALVKLNPLLEKNIHALDD